MNTDPWPYDLCPRLLGMHELIAESKTTATRGSYLALTGGDLMYSVGSSAKAELAGMFQAWVKEFE